MPRLRRSLLLLALLAMAAAPERALAVTGGWPWPVIGPIIRGYEPPAGPYGPGHRGIDIGSAVGTSILSPARGVVTFAGKVGGQLFVTLDHGGGISTTYSWISVAMVRKNYSVAQGEVIGLSGAGHPGSTTPHLHFGVKLNGAYVDPFLVLSAGSVVDLIGLAPIPVLGG
jgi:murein DD-endopeptidase MepM/ murein hydrolase activator NlpD